MTSSAIAALTDAFDAPLPQGGGAAGADAPVAVISWPSVPIEIVRAAGLEPRFVRGAPGATPAAAAHLEPGIFPNRLYRLVEAALTGRLSGAACVIVPRTSDPDYKCFLYLREMVRRGVVDSLPPVLLFDLLQSHGQEVRDYDAARVRELFRTLASLTGRRASLDDLRQQIGYVNAARAARGRLLAFRHGSPRVSGTEALPLLGAFWQTPPDAYAALAAEATAALAPRPALEGPRVLVTGAPVDGTALHAAIESHGAVVVAETSPWGAGAPGPDLDESADPMAAIADAYRVDAITPRTPVDIAHRRVAGAVDVDAVVVSLPDDDAVFGWDYPVLRESLASRGIPHVVLRDSPHDAVTDAAHSRLASLLAQVPVVEGRHG
jgi:hypothetical protein